MFRIFFLGQLLGLPTLKSVLTRFEIKSNNYQINYYKVCKRLSNKDLELLFEECFESIVASKLMLLSNKHSSNWSRELVTAVIDDSIFRQWLTTQEGLAEFDNCYSRFFSGQFGRVVRGWKVVTFGLSIDGVFYPMYFEHAPKGKKATNVAIKQIEKWDRFRIRLYKRQHVWLPCIPLSCDSGYNSIDLARVCKKSRLRYISVPQKSHSFEIQGKKWKLSEYISKVVKPLEEKWRKSNSLKPFKLRIRARYKSKDVDVILLFFRLNGSKKISVIYTTELDMHKKTMRRHWFQRTYIEQFFKWLKHILKIQHAITRTKQQFDLKLYRFAFIALHGQLLVRFIRKKNKRFRIEKMSFQVLQRQLTAEPEIIELLATYIH